MFSAHLYVSKPQNLARKQVQELSHDLSAGENIKRYVSLFFLPLTSHAKCLERNLASPSYFPPNANLLGHV
jgi:hypothetical protein